MMNGLRLKQVREFLGFTQSELALQLEVNQSTIAYLEGGYLQPSEDLLRGISECTGFPQAYFEQTEVTEFSQGSLLYRSRNAVDASERVQVNRYGQFMFEVAEKLSSRLRYPQFKLPRGGEVDAVTAAAITRSALGFTPDRPIDDLIYELEHKGVFIFKSPVLFKKVDAFAVWAGYENKKPVIVLTGDTPADRVRWTVAHELGHLVLHSTLFGDIQEFERQADMFAAELLLPEETMSRLVIEPFNLMRAARIRSEWKVSIQSIVRRAHDLQLISDNTYKSLFVQISQQKEKLAGLRAADVPEKPRCLRSMAETLYGVKINYRQLSVDTKFPIEILKRFIGAQASQEEYTRQGHEGKILGFPGGRVSGGGEDVKEN